MTIKNVIATFIYEQHIWLCRPWIDIKWTGAIWCLFNSTTVNHQLPFQQGTLCSLESDPIKMIKFKCRCSTGINSWPLLFLIYINDIVNSSNVLSFVHFADDTTIYVQNYSIDSAIEILTTKFAKVALRFWLL